MDLSTNEIERRFLAGNHVRALAPARDGQSILASENSGRVRLWSLLDARPIQEYAGHTKLVPSLAVTSSGDAFLSGGHDGLVRLWDARTAEPRFSFTGKYSNAIGLSPDGETAVHSLTNNQIVIWSTRTGRISHEIPRAFPHPIGGIAFTPDGERFITGDAGGVVQVWDLASGEEIYRFESHTGNICGIACTPDGRYGISSGLDKSLRLYDLIHGREVQTVEVKTWCTTYLAISPDGRRLATGGGYSPGRMENGRWIHSSDGDHVIRLWSLPEPSD